MHLFLIFTFCLGAYSDNPVPPREWTVDLDKPPATRWPFEEMLPYYNQSIHDAVALLNEVLPSWLVAGAESLASLLIPSMGDYGLEIQANAPKIGIPVGAGVLLNIFYEIEAGCTSIVARDSKGNIYHGRNLDFDLASVLRHLVINVKFQRKGKTIYSGTTYAGYVGLLTGVRQNSFSVTINQRDEGYIWENFLEALFIPGTRVLPFLVRDTLETTEKFSTAVHILSTTSLAAPCYITVSGPGPNDGVVITRNRIDTEDLWYLGDSLWYLAQTNDDHWTPDTDGRSTAAKQLMDRIGTASVNLQTIFGVLSTEPVLDESTTYTSLMSVATGNLTTFIRRL